MQKAPEDEVYKITDYSDLIGWEIQSVMDLGMESNGEKIYHLTLCRLGKPGITRRAFAEARYIPIQVIYFGKR